MKVQKRLVICFAIFILMPFYTLQAQDSLGISFVSNHFNYWHTALGTAGEGNISFVSTGHTGIQVVEYNERRGGDIIDANDQLYSSDVKLSDRYVFSLNRSSGFSILHRDNLEIISTWEEPGRYADILIYEDYLFLSDTSDVHIFDISDLGAPQFHQSLDLGSGAAAICRSGDLLFAACGPRVLRIVNISDIENPRIISEIEHDGRPYDVEVKGNYALVAARDAGLRIIDISNPENPEEREPLIPEDRFEYFLRIAVQDSFLFLPNYHFPPEILVYWIDNDGNITERRGLDTPAFVHNISTSAEGLYCTWGVDDIKASTYWNTTNLRRISDPLHNLSWGKAFRIKCFNELSFMLEGPPDANWWELNFDDFPELPGVFIINTENPSNPIPIRKLGQDFAKDVIYNDGLVFLLTSHQWLIYDISNIERPRRLRYIERTDDESAITLSGALVCVSEAEGHLIDIWDISSPEEPVLNGTIDNICSDIHLIQDLLYCVGNELRIYNIESPEEPELITNLDEFPGSKIEIEGEIAYIYSIEEEQTGLYLVDISNPQEPATISYYETPNGVNDYSVQNGYIYMAHGTQDGVVIADANDPENILEVGYYNTRGEAFSVAANEQYAYVADGMNMSVFNCRAALGENLPPRWRNVPGNEIVFSETDTASFEILVVDINDDDITIEMDLDNFPDDAHFTDNGDGTANFEWLTTYEDRGNYDGQLFASDGEHDINRPIRVSIRNTNRPPVVEIAIPDIVCEEDCGEVLVASIDTLFSDPDGENLEYRIFCEANSLNARLDRGGLISFNPRNNFNCPDGVEVSFTAIDPHTNTDSSFTVFLTPVNDPPTEFDLRQPPNNIVMTDFGTLFQWSPSTDIDADTIDYNIHLRLPYNEVDTVFTWNAGIEVSTDLRNLDTLLNNLDITQDTVQVTWNVTASDEEFTIPSNQSRIVFLPPTLGIQKKNENIPTEIALHPPYPNPFNNKITVSFGLPSKNFTSVRIYNQRGRLIEKLIKEELTTGHHSINWNASSAATGIYFVKMKCGEFSAVRKVVLVR